MGKINQIIKDVNGNFSSKRVITFICVILMTLGFMLDLFVDLSVPQYMFEAIMYIVITGVGFSGAEHFSKNKTSITGS